MQFYIFGVMNVKTFVVCVVLSFLLPQCAQQRGGYRGIDSNMGNLHKLSDARSRSLSAENFSGAKGAGGMDRLSDTVLPHHALSANHAKELGQGWKLNPAIKLKPGETFTLAEIDGPGAIQHIWMTLSQSHWSEAILRIYWDGEASPSVETPLGDFFCMGLNRYAPVNSLPVVVNPGNGFNSYWTMPFRKRCKMTVENKNNTEFYLFYQIDYVLAKVEKDDAYFHAQFRRERGTPTSVYTIVDKISGQGQYVGLYMTWKSNNPGWWGEGEIKFYIDGDDAFPTINGTGTEDYFLGSYGWYVVKDGKLKPGTYTTNYSGVPQLIMPDSVNNLDYPYYGMYRWHIKDPVYFSKDLKVTMQDLGWKSGGGTNRLYLAQHSDISSVVYWYQKEPHGAFPELDISGEPKIK